MFYLLNETNTNESLATVQWTVYTFGILITLLFIRFVIQRKGKLFILQFKNGSIGLGIIGWLIKDPEPNDEIIILKSNFLGRKYNVELNTKYFDAKIDFRFGIRKCNVVIGKFVSAKKRYRKLDITMTKEQYNILGQSTDVLTELNKIVDKEIEKEMSKFKNVSLATIEVTQKLNSMSDEVINSMRNMLQGTKDWTFIAQKMYNLDRDELNIQLGEDMLKKKILNDLKAKVIKTEEENRSKLTTKKSILKRKSKGVKNV